MKAIALVVALFFIKCEPNKSKKVVEGDYRGYWARTYWLWTFSDNKFKLSANGYLGHKETIGTFSARNDSLFLQFSKDDIRPGVHEFERSDTLLISGDRCLISVNDERDYCKQKGNNPNEIHFSKSRKFIPFKGKRE